MSKILLKDVKPFIHIEENKAYTNNGSILFGYRMVLPEVFSLDADDYESLHDKWFMALKNLPAGTIVHRMDLYLSEKFDSDWMPGQTFLQKATKNHFKDKYNLTHFPFLFFTLPNPSVINQSSITNPFKSPCKSKELMQKMEQNSTYQTDVERAVDYVNSQRVIELMPMSAEELKFVEFSFFNGFYPDRKTDIDFSNLTVGEKQIGVFAIPDATNLGDSIKTSVIDSSMSTSTNKFHQGFLEGLGLRLECDHILNTVIFIRDHSIEKNKIEEQKKSFFGSRKFAQEYERGAEKLTDYLNELADDDSIRLVAGHVNVLFFANSDAQYKTIQGQISSAFKNLDILPYFPTGQNKKNLFANSFPGFISNIDLDNIISPIDLKILVCFFVNTTNYRSDTGGILFNDRLFNTPIYRDIWDKEKKRIKARNFFIMAPTGEGKSVLANHVLRQFYDQDVSIVIFDLGNSYGNISRLYPNDTVQIRYQKGNPLGINPFALFGAEADSSFIESIAQFLFIPYVETESAEKDTLKMLVSLKKVIAAYYKSILSGHDFYSFLGFIEEYKNDLLTKLELKGIFDINEFLHLWSEFGTGGIYNFVFQPSTGIDTQIRGKKWVIFEFDEVKDNSLLLSIFTQIASTAIEANVWSDRSKRSVVFFDEFAKMLKFPSILTTTEYFFQAIRKYNGAVGIVLQSPSQLPSNDIAKTMIENTQVCYIIQNTKGYSDVIKRFEYPSHIETQLNSLKSNFSGKVKYSEIGLMIGSYFNVVRLELPQEALLAYSTDGEEYTALDKIYQTTGDMELAIQKYLNP